MALCPFLWLSSIPLCMLRGQFGGLLFTYGWAFGARWRTLENILAWMKSDLFWGFLFVVFLSIVRSWLGYTSTTVWANSERISEALLWLALVCVPSPSPSQWLLTGTRGPWTAPPRRVGVWGLESQERSREEPGSVLLLSWAGGWCSLLVQQGILRHHDHLLKIFTPSNLVELGEQTWKSWGRAGVRGPS